MNILNIFLRISPIKIDRLSAWLALSWCSWLQFSNPFDTFAILVPLKMIAPETTWEIVFFIIAFSQFLGNFTRILFIRLSGAYLATFVWSFIAFKFLLITGPYSVAWLSYFLLAWGCGGTIFELIRGERRV